MKLNSMESSHDTLRSRLAYEPQALKFGTSGRRGEVAHLTQLEIYINALAELGYLQSLPTAEGGILRGEEFYFAYDLRPSTVTFVPEEKGRGELAQAVVRAIANSGMKPVNLGAIPTPALMYYAVSRGKGSIMITGSHIPFDRNGYKTNTSRGELLKKHEQPISLAVERVRARLYDQPFSESLFDETGMFKTGHAELPPAIDKARMAYIDRYLSFFAGQNLKNKRLLFYQHSAVGRDLVVEILERLGAEVIPAGRSETFVPIDTENIDAEQLNTIQALVDQAAASYGRIDAVISTDGDSDRPLVLGVDASTGQAKFFGGDLLGMIVADYLAADAVVVPISCNDAIDRGTLAAVTEPKTRIGSPFVIAGMEQALAKGKHAVCGWEANGGFLTGSDIRRGDAILTALPTRDAVLPLLAVLFSAAGKSLTLPQLFATLPSRFSRAALLKNFPRSVGLKIVHHFSPSRPEIQDVVFNDDKPVLLDADGATLAAPDDLTETMAAIRASLAQFFSASKGFSAISKLNYTDGVRIIFANGDVAHLRPSGNADELRLYVVADTQARAEAIAAMGVAEPDGILRSIENSITNTN
jgi:phosphomannomutase